MAAIAVRIAVIFSGGEGRRMGGGDKGAIMLAGRRLIDHVIRKLEPQADRILISGPDDYGSGLTHVPDRKDGPVGPVAGLWSAFNWIKEEAFELEGFLTAPVDGPFLPSDLYERLCARENSSIAKDEAGVHPTFGWWRMADLQKVFRDVKPSDAPSLKGIARKVSACEISFPGTESFKNLNTPDEIAEAEIILSRKSNS